MKSDLKPNHLMSDLTTKQNVQENINLAADGLWALAWLDGKRNSKSIEYTEVNQFILYSTNTYIKNN